jgi:Mg-chelatase subunit ChlD
MIPILRSLAFCLVFLAANGALFAQNRFNVYTPDAEKFPKVRAFYEATDNNNIPIPGLTSNDFRIVENGITIPASDITQKCSTIVDGPELSVVLVLDKSASMSEQVGSRPEETRFRFVKQASKLFVSLLNFIGRTKVAVVSFDGQAYLEHDWSNNRNSLLQAIDSMILGSATYYDPPLLHKQWGAITLIKDRYVRENLPATVKKVVIFLTDGEPNKPPTRDTIRKELLDNGIAFYAITAFTGMNKDLATWADITGGDHYEANSKDAYSKLQEIYAEIAKKLQAKEVCYLEWNSPMGCNEESRTRTVHITLQKNINIIDTSVYQAPATSVLQMAVNPPIVSFGNPAVGASTDKTVDVEAKNGKLIITADPPAPSGNASFIVTTFNGNAWNGSTPQTIDSGTIAKIGVRFTQGTTLDFRQSALRIQGNPCNPPLIPLVGGSADIQLLDPINSEIRSTCNDLTILWAGVDSTQEVIIQYSADNGVTWNLLTDKATGLKYIWSSEELKKLSTNGQYKIRVGLPPSKTYVWVKNVGGTLTDSSVSIALSPDGQNSFIAGNFEGNGSFDGKPLASNSGSRDGFFAKLDIGGNVQFAKNIGGPGLDAITGIAAGDNDIAYITGHFVGESTFGFVNKKSSSLTGKNFFMARVEADGATVIVNTLGATTINPTAEAYGERIAWDPFEKRVYVEGMYKGVLTATMRDGTRAQISNRTQPIVWKPFTAVFDPSGNWLDLQPTRTQGKPYTTLNATDKDGCLYETGTFTGSLTKNPGNKTITSAGQTDGFISKFCGTPSSSSSSLVPFPLAKARLYSIDSNIRFNVGVTAVGTPKDQVLSTGICNDGNLDTFIDSVSISDPQFSLKSVLNGRLFPSVNCDTVPIEVLFTPTTPGDHCATLTFYATCSPVVKMTICGTAVEPCDYVHVEDTTFTNTLVGARKSITITKALENKSNILINGKMSIGGANPGDFVIASYRMIDRNGNPSVGDPSNTFTIKPGGHLEITTEFAPTAVGKRLAFIDLGLDTVCVDAKVQLSGEGEAQLTASATDAIWNCVPVGGKDRKDVIITNDGNSELAIQSITLQQNNGTFALFNVPTLPVNLTKGQTISVTVEFAPTVNQNGLWDSVLVTAVSAVDPSIKAPNFGARVQGNGCIGAPEYTKNCVNDTRIGEKSAPKSNALVIKNMGQGPLKVLSIKPIPPIEFESIAPTGPFDIPLNGSQDISAIFIPQKKGLRSGFVEIITDARNVPDTVEICGTGFLEDTVINLGKLNACENPVITIPYPNVSSYDIDTKSSAKRDIDQFSITPLGDITVKANTNQEFTIVFTPNRTGTFSIEAQLGERTVFVNAEATTLPMTITSSINPGEVTPGQKVAFKVNSKITGDIGNAKINSLDILLNYDAGDLDFTGTVRSLNGWTWTPTLNGNQLTVSGSGSTGLTNNTDLFEADFNAYLGDSVAFNVFVDARTTDVFAKCLIIDNDTSTLKLSPICFANGRFIRGSGLGYALKVTGQSPATDIATLEYSIGLSSNTIIELYNSMGQKVHTLLEGHVKEGAYQLSIDAQQMPAGVYTCILKSGPFTDQVQFIISR